MGGWREWGGGEYKAKRGGVGRGLGGGVGAGWGSPVGTIQQLIHFSKACDVFVHMVFILFETPKNNPGVSYLGGKKPAKQP